MSHRKKSSREGRVLRRKTLRGQSVALCGVSSFTSSVLCEDHVGAISCKARGVPKFGGVETVVVDPC